MFGRQWRWLLLISATLLALCGVLVNRVRTQAIHAICSTPDVCGYIMTSATDGDHMTATFCPTLFESKVAADAVGVLLISITSRTRIEDGRWGIVSLSTAAQLSVGQYVFLQHQPLADNSSMVEATIIRTLPVLDLRPKSSCFSPITPS